MALRKRPGYMDAMIGTRQNRQGDIDGSIGEFQRPRQTETVPKPSPLTTGWWTTRKKSHGGVDLIIPASVADHDDLLDSHLVELSELGQEQLMMRISKVPRPRSARSSARRGLWRRVGTPDRRPGRAALPQRKVHFEDGMFREASYN